MKKFILSCSLLLSACSHLPPAIENPPVVDISYIQAIQKAPIYKKAAVRWGGIIIDVENEQYQSYIQVLLYPLNSYGRPQLEQSSVGRFMIKSPSFLDPVVYIKNTEITVAGTLDTEVERTIDKKTLKLPVVLAQTLYLWPKYEPNNYYNSYGIGYGGYGGFGPFGGYYGGFGGRWGGWGGYPYYGGGYYAPYYRYHRR